MRSRRAVPGGLVLAAVAALTGCGDAAERDFCRQYAGLVEQAEEFRQIDARTAPPGTLTSAAVEFRTELDQLAAVSEGRLDFAVSGLRNALDNLRVTAIDVGDDALDTARPLLEDSLDDVREAWAVLQASAATECGDT
jgi:hypothetical protein